MSVHIDSVETDITPNDNQSGSSNQEEDRESRNVGINNACEVMLGQLQIRQERQARLEAD